MRRLCENMGTAITHRNALAFSRENTQQAVPTFLSEHGSPHATLFEDTDWLVKL